MIEQKIKAIVLGKYENVKSDKVVKKIKKGNKINGLQR